MLGLSLAKILFTIGIAIAVWRGYALYNRLTSQTGGSAANRKSTGGPRSRPDQARTVELEQCSRCGAYVDPRQGCSCTPS